MRRTVAELCRFGRGWRGECERFFEARGLHEAASLRELVAYRKHARPCDRVERQTIWRSQRGDVGATGERAKRVCACSCVQHHVVVGGGELAHERTQLDEARIQALGSQRQRVFTLVAADARRFAGLGAHRDPAVRVRVELSLGVVQRIAGARGV